MLDISWFRLPGGDFGAVKVLMMAQHNGICNLNLVKCNYQITNLTSIHLKDQMVSWQRVVVLRQVLSSYNHTNLFVYPNTAYSLYLFWYPVLMREWGGCVSVCVVSA